MELIEQLVSQLGVSEDQAKGGTGLLLNLAKEKLGGEDFGKISDLIPGAASMMGDAPDADAGGGGLMGAIGSVASSLGVDAGGLGQLAELAGGFSKLDLDGDMVQKFVEIVTSFLTDKGGDAVGGILKSLTS